MMIDFRFGCRFSLLISCIKIFNFGKKRFDITWAAEMGVLL